MGAPELAGFKFLIVARGKKAPPGCEDAAAVLVNVELFDGHENLDVHVLRPPRDLEAHARASVSHAATCTAPNGVASKADAAAPVGECSRPDT